MALSVREAAPNRFLLHWGCFSDASSQRRVVPVVGGGERADRRHQQRDDHIDRKHGQEQANRGAEPDAWQQGAGER